ncbi:RluA family pseudouridine synthase [Solwaraspora sp. WMMB335]|uniref:RluA family pseudouridine synthase n=1 Tax=Solwaraspora sp. WMMB335 TaxID=3404118 RepID=UPI003B94B23B
MNLWSDLRADAVLYEDGAALVLNKPAGTAVMGERHGTDLVRLAEETGEQVFPVHRIDKNTSGAILFAKELRHHGDLTRQFNRRTVDKVYLAVVCAADDAGPPPEVGVVDLPLSVGRKNRVRVAGNRADIGYDQTAGRWALAPGTAFDDVRSYPSQTRFVHVAGDPAHRLLAVAPLTGRRHQIRVHLAWIGQPIVGDPLFDKAAAANGTRTHLHAWRLGFDTADGDRVEVTAPPDAEFWQPLPGGPPTGADLHRAYQRLHETG